MSKFQPTFSVFLISHLLLIIMAVGTACERDGPRSVPQTSASVPPPPAPKQYESRWETPSDYTPLSNRKIGHRGRSKNGGWSYNLSDLHVAMRVRSGEPAREGWVEWWQIDCLKAAARNANCILSRLVLRDKDRVGAVLPHIWTESTYDETLRIEDADWENGSLALSTTSPLEQIRVRLNWAWAGNLMELRDVSAAGSREHIEAAGSRLESLEFLPVNDSQVLTVPIAIRGRQQAASD